MTKRTVLLLCLALALAMVCPAADVTGKWVAQIPGRDGELRESTFELKADGATLTGTMSGRGEPAPIADGKIDGDKISFTVTREFGGNTMKWTFTGTVAGDEIKMKREGGPGEPREFAAKRAK
ncbi:MAG: hypothetical protein C0504_19660 [Candidatus Solibacter sp.]|nr:hypothetical protein [Candidatus Solibacter sp.]